MCFSTAWTSLSGLVDLGLLLEGRELLLLRRELVISLGDSGDGAIRVSKTVLLIGYVTEVIQEESYLLCGSP